MHVHLPKPLHGWRAFVGEVGIIVLGVLIALGFEQIAETVSWSERVRHARKSLLAEVTAHYAAAVEWRSVEPCISAQLDRLEQRLLASGDRIEPAPLFREDGRTFTLRAPSRVYPGSVWRGVLDEGVSSHLTEKERLDLGRYYQQLGDLDAENKELTGAATKLNSLARPIALDPSARLSLLQSIDQIRDTNRWMAIDAGQLVAQLVDVHMVPPESDARTFLARSGTVAFCREHQLPLRPVSEAMKPVS